jgi:catechol 2,3-dioxygenase-like lactoylglutathione lyase family enzyme
MSRTVGPVYPGRGEPFRDGAAPRVRLAEPLAEASIRFSDYDQPIMIDHTGFNVSDLEKSKDFYSKALAPLGYSVSAEIDEISAGFGAPQSDEDDPGGDFWIALGEPQTPRTHVAFRAASKKEVDQFYKAALKAGGTDNGPPGERPHYHRGYYAAYVHDPDGYNVEAVFHGAASEEAEA